MEILATIIHTILNDKPTKQQLKTYIKWNNIKNVSKMSLDQLHKHIIKHINDNNRDI